MRAIGLEMHGRIAKFGFFYKGFDSSSRKKPSMAQLQSLSIRSSGIVSTCNEVASESSLCCSKCCDDSNDNDSDNDSDNNNDYDNDGNGTSTIPTTIA